MAAHRVQCCPREGDRQGAQVRKALASEVADLLYHLLVLCAERRLEPAAALEVLRERRRA
ncbi:MAG: hypothetical protein ACLQBX_08795 [Candidatus Limnocylindrales bacterium]